MSRTLIALALGAFCLSSPPSSPASPSAHTPDPDSLLSEARDRYESLGTLRATFRQSIEMRVFDPPRTREGNGTWYQERPDRFRMDFADPEGDLIVADGSHLWLYYPSTHPGQVIRSELAAERARGTTAVDLQGRIFQEARLHFDASYAGRDTLDGHAVHRLLLEPRTAEAPYREVEIWLDASSLLVRRLRLEDRSETVRTVTLDELSTGVPLADSLFRFEPPPDVEVFRG